MLIKCTEIDVECLHSVLPIVKRWRSADALTVIDMSGSSAPEAIAELLEQCRTSEQRDSILDGSLELHEYGEASIGQGPGQGYRIYAVRFTGVSIEYHVGATAHRPDGWAALPERAWHLVRWGQQPTIEEQELDRAVLLYGE